MRKYPEKYLEILKNETIEIENNGVKIIVKPSPGEEREGYLDPCEKAIMEELAKNEPSVIISRRPCVLLKYVKLEKPLFVNRDKCKSCKKCISFGCPAISMHDNKAEIDSTLCVGCSVCEQLCPFGAFEKEVND